MCIGNCCFRKKKNDLFCLDGVCLRVGWTVIICAGTLVAKWEIIAHDVVFSGVGFVLNACPSPAPLTNVD
jgi:hypothetical protein